MNLSSFFFRDVPSTEADPICTTRIEVAEVVAGEDEEEEAEAEAIIDIVGLLDLKTVFVGK